MAVTKSKEKSKRRKEVVKNATKPSIETSLTVNIRPDSDLYLPVADGNGGFELKVGGLSEQMQIPPRTSCLLDCGMQITKPSGTRIAVEVGAEWAKKGLLLLSHQFVGARLQVMACNIGKQILAFGAGDTVGSFYFVSAARALVKVDK